MTDTAQGRAVPRDPLERGRFNDGYREFAVRASSATAPDSFQVHTGPREDIVLVVSGLNSGDLKATWGPGWREVDAGRRAVIEDTAFAVFYNVEALGGFMPGRQKLRQDPDTVRFCRG